MKTKPTPKTKIQRDKEIRSNPAAPEQAKAGKKRTKKVNNQRYFDEGVKAYTDGKNECPYPFGTDGSVFWKAGHEASKRYPTTAAPVPSEQAHSPLPQSAHEPFKSGHPDRISGIHDGKCEE